MTAVRSVVVCDLTGYAKDGQLSEAGELAAWSVLADLPPGRDVRLVFGSVCWTTERFRELIAEYLVDARTVQVEGARFVLLDAMVGLLSTPTAQPPSPLSAVARGVS